MNTLSRLTLAAGAALFVGISTTGFNAQGHPHGDKLKKQAETKIAIPHTPAPKPMPMTGEVAVDNGAPEDFNINDFLGDNGRVDVKKLRAYENKKQRYIEDNEDSSAVHDSAQISVMMQAGPIAEDMASQDLPRDIEIDKIVDLITPFRRGSSDTVRLREDDSVKAEIRIEKIRPERSTLTETHHGDKKHHGKPETKKGRTISLSGDTTIHIAPDGAITVTNNGETVMPLSMTGVKAGKASAMVMDDCAPAKITVEKKVKVEDGKRKVRVEVDMESEILD